jgi:hypothetical protein
MEAMRSCLWGSFALVLLATNAMAGERCFMRAPSHAPTAVRLELNGSTSTGGIANGTQVSMWRVEKDRAGQRWAYVTSLEEGDQGYVPRDFLVCF